MTWSKDKEAPSAFCTQIASSSSSISTAICAVPRRLGTTSIGGRKGPTRHLKRFAECTTEKFEFCGPAKHTIIAYHTIRSRAQFWHDACLTDEDIPKIG